MKPRFSIITVCFNSSYTIEETIRSVLSQNYNDVEYIIIDGGSKDTTLSIIKKYQDRITKVVSEPDHGIYDAMNKGIKLAQGEIIGILNSDDLYMHDNVLKSVSSCFDSNPNANLVYGNLIYFGKTHINRYWRSKPYDESFFDNGNAIPHPTLFVKREVYNKFGLYNPKFKISSDYEFTLRVLKKYKETVHFMDEILVRMRVGGESTRNFRNILVGNREIVESWQMNNFSIPKLYFVKKIFRKVSQFF